MEDLERGGGGGPGHVVVIDTNTNTKNQYHPNKGQLLREQAQSLIHNVMEPHESGDSSLSSPLSSDVDARKKKAMSAALLVVLLYWWL
jgi:hypothetical protein